MPGDSTLDGFEDLIELQGFSWGSSNGQGGTAGCGTGADGSFFFDLTVTKHFDKSSQPIMLANLKGTDLGTIKLQLLKLTGGSHPQVYLTFELEHAHVASDQMSGGGGVIDEKVTFTSSKATVSYRTQKADGTPQPAHRDLLRRRQPGRLHLASIPDRITRPRGITHGASSRSRDRVYSR